MDTWTIVNPSGECERGDLLAKEGATQEEMDSLFDMYSTDIYSTSTRRENMERLGGFVILGYDGYGVDYINKKYPGYVVMRRNQGPRLPRKLPIGSRWSIPAPLP